MTCDLRRLPLHGIVERVPRSHLVVDPRTLSVDRPALVFGAVATARTGAQPVRVTAAGASASSLAWSVSVSDPHDVVELQDAAGVAGAIAGTGAGSFRIALRTGASLVGLSGDVAVVRVESAAASNSPHEIHVSNRQGAGAAPFGVVDAPAAGASVAGAVAVTGWALDDVEVRRVAVFRSPVAGERGIVRIGDALFVESARPDVAAAFAGYPRNARGGWGLMVLTNMLPNHGIGATTFHVYAYDTDGHSRLLGRRQVTGANDTTDLPFGTIDLPAQGATLSGTIPIFGWTLTPAPNIIPTDGSTIDVIIDGAVIGHPMFNQCRGTNGVTPTPGTCDDDIATMFGTSYRNIAEGSGAIGSFLLDTTTLTNGMHSMKWRVRDSAGKVQEIGSRYVYVQNN